LSESSIAALGEIRTYDLDTFMKVRDSLNTWKAKWEKTLKELGKEAMGLIDSRRLEADAFIQKNSGIYAYVRNLAAGLQDKIKPGKNAQKALESKEWINSKASPPEVAAFEEISPRVLEIGGKVLEMTSGEYPRYMLCRLLLNHLFSTALLSETEKTLNDLCLESNKLLISEFNRRISQIVRDQPAPFIYERLGEKYYNFLVDEFQDTSILQWHNLLPLIENSLASNRMNLVVGDAKQAIYRFRAGDALQLEMLPHLIKDNPDPLLDSREQTLIRHYQPENLSVNHRSAKVIVDFNNRFFTLISGILPEPYGLPFRDAVQETARLDKPGMVRIEKIGKNEDEDLTYQDLVHQKIAAVLRELKEDNFPLRDLAILCRDNIKASKIAAFLVCEGVPVISSESLLLSQSEHVNYLVAWIRHLVDPADNNPLMHILQYITTHGLAAGIRLEDFFGKNKNTDATGVYDALKKHFPFLDREQLRGLELFGLVQYLVYHFRLYMLDDSYLRFFQDQVLEFVQKKSGSLPEFIEWWEDKGSKASVIIPDGIDAVRIMTIHKAKGLQFPVVIYPFADEQVRSTRSHLWVPLTDEIARPLKTAYLPAQNSLLETEYANMYEDEMARSYVDMVNVLYVALTRPEERLYVLVKDFPAETDGKPSVPKLFSRFLNEEESWQPGNNLFQAGERWMRKTQVDINEKAEGREEPASCRPTLKMLLRPHAPQAWDMEDPEKNREWGNLVHLAMSKISKADEMEQVLEDLLIDGIVTKQQLEDLLALMKKILENSEISVFFDPSYEVRNEPEILTKDGILFRPDRVMTRDGRITIIDYKTGYPKEAHRRQVIEYSGLMGEMNCPVEGAYLLYLNKQPEVHRVI
jgi:ATP-dependent exoDNAse (exonuclease V) beta subunit